MDTKDKTEFEKMDKLEQIFFMQKLFDDDLAKNRNLNFSKEEWLQRQTLAMVSELSELLNEVNFKWWKNPKQLDDAAIKEELVDILHFFTGMCLRAGLTATELHTIYMKKNKENFDRQYGLSKKEGYNLK